ncbi:MAG: hypothetical protein ABJN34_15375 [Litoreibacter sp.]|uniref:hypothetical protein n=1 Tax=Litoreibacter sp. TaxID=1969459 RepID=UPI00329A062F
MRAILATLVIVSLGACTAHLPAIDDTIDEAARNADYPSLQPLPDLIKRSSAGSTIEAETDALANRVARLKARASALKGRTIIDGATRLKLLNSVKDRPA